jgi:hypothetical protein
VSHKFEPNCPSAPAPGFLLAREGRKGCTLPPFVWSQAAFVFWESNAPPGLVDGEASKLPAGPRRALGAVKTTQQPPFRDACSPSVNKTPSKPSPVICHRKSTRLHPRQRSRCSVSYPAPRWLSRHHRGYKTQNPNTGTQQTGSRLRDSCSGTPEPPPRNYSASARPIERYPPRSHHSFPLHIEALTKADSPRWTTRRTILVGVGRTGSLG